MTSSQRARVLPTGLLASVLFLLPAAASSGAEPTLSGTRALTIKQPLDEFMVDGINRFCLREIAASRERRGNLWQRDFSGIEAYTASVAANRDRFRQIIGAVDSRVTAEPKRFSFELLATLERSSILARTDAVTVHAVRWQVLDGVTAEGLLLKPERIRAGVVALPDADWTPEMFCGTTQGLPERVQLARRLAAAGCLVAIPTLISRSDEHSGHPTIGYTNLTHREFLYRQAFEMGRHPIGFEVQKVLAAVDLFEQMKSPAFPIGVVGVGEGGLVALYAAALDSRIDSTLVSGYFQEREGLWQEPIYRNVWRLLTEFGDAELASMIAPRRLVIEACRAIEVSGPPAVRTGRRKAAAPGRIETNSLTSVQAEFHRVAAIYRRLGRQSEIVLNVSGEDGAGPAGSSQAVAEFVGGLGIQLKLDGAPAKWQLEVAPIADVPRDARDREKRQFDEMQVFVQDLMRRSPRVRDNAWKSDLSSVESWLPSRNKLRDRVHDELIGRLRTPRVPPNPRTRLVLETDDYRGYEVVLEVVPDVIAAGILLLPNDLKAGEQRPVVVCQHGLERTAMDTMSREPSAYRSYKAFADKLCRRGFIVYSPQNPYRGKDRFRTIQRKSNPLGLSLFSFIIAQHQQTLDWLATLPHVDADRIAFYGLSYGGKTAMRVPPFVDRYCLSICSGDFTDWVRTITTNEERYGYIFTGEYEIPEWNMGHIASYAELAMLMSPRPFMVEQGHRDGGAPTEWVLGEYGKVRRHYDQLKIGDQTEIEFFDGPHTINGVGTFRFLHQHLKWPAVRNP
jgi:dienelactone hydrolase